MRWMKRVLRGVLFCVPGGRGLYVRVYAPLVARTPWVRWRVSLEETEKSQAELQSALRETEKSRAELQSALRETEKSRAELQSALRETEKSRAALQDGLAKVLAVEDEWAVLLREALEHLEFLHKFLTPLDESEGAARTTLEEFRRHMMSLILVFRALLARQEAQMRLAEALLRGHPGPQYTEREARLEKVVEYLVNLQGDDPPA